MNAGDTRQSGIAAPFSLKSLLAELRVAPEQGGVLSWRKLMQPGDWLVVALGAIMVASSFAVFWRGGTADRAIIRRDGQIVAELLLSTPRTYELTGPIGNTLIEVQPGRARVLADPGPRQYCVQQGWLTRANAVAICAPNHISLQLSGGANKNDNGYDSLNY